TLIIVINSRWSDVLWPPYFRQLDRTAGGGRCLPSTTESGPLANPQAGDRFFRSTKRVFCFPSCQFRAVSRTLPRMGIRTLSAWLCVGVLLLWSSLIACSAQSSAQTASHPFSL